MTSEKIPNSNQYAKIGYVIDDQRIFLHPGDVLSLPNDNIIRIISIFDGMSGPVVRYKNDKWVKDKTADLHWFVTKIVLGK